MKFIKFSALKSQEHNADTRKCEADQEPCVRCGKPVSIGKKTAWIWIVGGGGVLAPVGYEMPEEGQPGDVGLHPIGPSCRKGIPKTFIHSITPDP